MVETKKTPTLFQSLIPIISIALFLGIGYGIFHLRIEFLLLGAATVTGIAVGAIAAPIIYHNAQVSNRVPTSP